jgi:hypothetical protein
VLQTRSRRITRTSCSFIVKPWLESGVGETLVETRGGRYRASVKSATLVGL